MKVLVLLLSLVFTVFAALNVDSTLWVNFKSEHGKKYKNLQEENLRFSIFQQNVRAIEEHNKKYESGETTYRQMVSYFADLSNEEFVSLLKRQSTDRPNLETNYFYKNYIGDAVPQSIDWREKGAVSKVKDQGSCGASWVFSVTGTLEGFNFVKTTKLVTLSIQQLMDCASENGGCTGSDLETGLQYVKEHGIETEDSYPDGGNYLCQYNVSDVFLRIKDFVYIESKNEEDLVSAVGLLGPISVELDASQLAFYQTGVFSSNDCSQDLVNHVLLAIGYGTDENTGLDYWLVKNSWGSSWGEEGYFKIKRGTNECGIATQGVYPVLY